MSFALDVKDEVARSDFGTKSGMKAELAAMIRINGALSLGNNDVITTIKIDHPTTAKRIFTLFKELFPEIDIHVSVKKRMKLNKRNTYVLSIAKSRDYYKNLGISFNFEKEKLEQLLKTEVEQKAYVKSLFLACGSINSPETTSYHLELAFDDEEHAQIVKKVLNSKEYRLEAKLIARRTKTILYIKKASLIADFLKLIGAFETLIRFEDVRIMRDYSNSLHRANNMDVANQMRTNKAASEIIEVIQYIDDHYGLEYLEEKIQRVAMIRLQYPEENMSELVNIYEEEFGDKISKSGINHKFRKLREIKETMEETNDRKNRSRDQEITRK